MFNLFNLIDEVNEEKVEKKNNSVEHVAATTETTTKDTEKIEVAATTEIPGSDDTTATEKAEAKEEVVKEETMKETQKLTDANDEVKTDFNEFDVSEKEKVIEEAANQTNANSKDNTPSNKKEDTFEPNEFTVIRYFGQDIAITEYITAEELAEGVMNSKKERTPVTAEILRKRMEKDYPELVKSHTEMLFIEKKGATYVVPTIKAKKKGAETVSLGTVSALPLIPFSILGNFIKLAEKFSLLNLEIHADIYFDSIEKRYLLDVPGQTVHQYYCEVDEDALSILDRVGMNCSKIAEIHSHHTMAPTPSSQDNQSETVKGMTYIIVGNIDKFFPSITARRYNGIGWDNLDLHNVFAPPSYELPTFDESKIKFAYKEGVVSLV